MNDNDWSRVKEHKDHVNSLTSPSYLPTSQYSKIMSTLDISKLEFLCRRCFKSQLRSAIEEELSRFDFIQDHKSDNHHEAQTYRNLKTDSLRRIQQWIADEIEQRLEEDG